MGTISYDEEECSSSFAVTFNFLFTCSWVSSKPSTANLPKSFNPVHVETVYKWVKDFSGAIKYMEGMTKPSKHYTAIDLHKTDSCARFYVRKSRTRCFVQRMKRHRQQNDQGTHTRERAS